MSTYALPGSPDHSAQQAKPPVVVQASKGLLRLDLRPVWEYRELLYFLVWRDVKVRYKQTAIGAPWPTFQPLLPVMIFPIPFVTFPNLPPANLPHPIFPFPRSLP